MFEAARDWFFSLGPRYGVNPLIFGSIYVGAIPLHFACIAWLIRDFRRKKPITLPLLLASFFFVSAYLYLIVAGRSIPAWVYFFIAAMVVFGGYSVFRKVRKALRAGSGGSWVALGLVWLVFPPGAESGGGMFDHSIWNEILQKYVNSESRVDYRALKERDTAKLDGYLQQLAGPWPQRMAGPEQKAALINAYNALTVRWIVSKYPVESIWRTRHPFTDARHTLDGQKTSLDQIEARLRNMGDPRIHAALVCAARSCPPLRREAYEAARIDSQLDANARAWLANATLNEFFPDRRVARVSVIFKWYRDDFERNGSSVADFLARFGPAEKTQFLRQPATSIEYKTYHWGLNDSSRLGSGYSRLQFLLDAAANKLF